MLIRTLTAIFLAMVVWSVQAVDASAHVGASIERSVGMGSALSEDTSVVVDDLDVDHLGGGLADCAPGCVCSVFHHVGMNAYADTSIPIEFHDLFELVNDTGSSLVIGPPVRPPLL